jgi:hypothetical protein
MKNFLQGFDSRSNFDHDFLFSSQERDNSIEENYNSHGVPL